MYWIFGKFLWQRGTILGYLVTCKGFRISFGMISKIPVQGFIPYKPTINFHGKYLGYCCLSHRNEVILDLQKFQIQPMDTVNPDHLHLLILSANPDASVETTHGESETVPTIEVETVMIAEEAGILVPGENNLLKTAQTSSTSNKDLAGDKQFKCLQCNKSFAGPSSLSRHIKTHSNEKPFACIQCNKVFSRLSSLKRHENSHSEEKPFKCQVCGWSFIQNSDLKIHERTHTGEKPFPCDRCERAFGCKKRLKAHYRMHTGEKPYKCPQCEKSFSMRKNVIQHLRIHTGERPFTCEVCKKTYRHQHTLKKHMRLHTVRLSYSTSTRLVSVCMLCNAHVCVRCPFIYILFGLFEFFIKSQAKLTTCEPNFARLLSQ